MVKIHSKQKRHLGLSTHKGGFKHKSNKTKSFTSEASAKKWAEDNNIKNYQIVRPNWGLTKKFKVVEKH